MKKLLLIIYIFLLSCTAYKPMGFNGIYIDGYDESQYGDNIFRVSFDGNVFDRYNRIYDFNLYRCAELTIMSNYRYFIILKEENHHMFSYSNFISRINPWQGPQSVITIACYKEEPLEFSYDASFILQSIDPYNLSQTSNKKKGYFRILWDDIRNYK